MTEQPTTREIQMTLTEFNAERGGSMADAADHGLGGHTFVKHADGSVRELSSFGNEMAVFHLVHESHIESGGPEGYEPTAS